MLKGPTGARSATLAKGLDVLNAIEASDTPLRLREIANALDMTKPTTHRLLATLVDYGLVRYDPERTTYQLGMRLFEMSRRVWEDFDLRGMAAAEMTRLHQLTNEAISLAIVVDDTAVCIDEIESRHRIKERSRVGQRMPLWKTAIGKALMAGLQFDARQKILDQIEKNELANSMYPTIETLTAHLDLVNGRGYAIEDQEHHKGIMGVAAPIVDHRGLTVAAIGLSGPSERLPKEKLHELGPALIEATRRASLQAGGAPRPVSKTRKPTSPSPISATPLVDIGNLVGESPLYDERRQRLYWVDIYKPAIYRLNLSDGSLVTHSPGEMVTALDLVPEGLLIASQSGIRIIDPETGEEIRFLCHPEKHIPTNRYNEGKCDSCGRFWVGTLAFNVEANAGSLYRIDPDGRSTKMETHLTLPNGMGWSPDNKTMYLTDTSDRVIYAYDFFEKDGEISNRRELIRFSDDALGNPDGLTVDGDGNLWLAVWDGWRICCFSAEGKLLDEFALPVPRPTSCAFGKREDRVLYVTSARIRVSEMSMNDAPHSGAVFAVQLPDSL